MPENAALALALAEKLNIEIGSIELRDFPDGECYVRVLSEVAGKKVLLVCSLDHPNIKILPLFFLAQTLHELGANQICLISPYLAYLRQDKRFKTGEAITSGIFAKFVSGWVDSLVTFDPHLHRIHNLAEIYPSKNIITLHAGQKIAAWIKDEVTSPLLIGPDEESAQWVSKIAVGLGAPYVVVKKTRYGDREVSISLPELNDLSKTPVLIDDIISTGTSMLTLIQQLLLKGFKKPVCIAIHALFNKEIYTELLETGAVKIVTCNTIPHFSNVIDVTDILVDELKNNFLK